MNGKRKQRILYLAPILMLFLCLSCIAVIGLNTYRKLVFEHLSAFCEIAAENNPESEQYFLTALKEYQTLTEQEIDGNHYLEKYGYHAGEFYQVFPSGMFLAFFLLSLILVFSFGCGLRKIHRHNQRRAAYLTEYLENINIGAESTLIQTQEDDFSHLQDEIYKTVTMLYQTRESAVASKKRYAENLANIAHQLKTPITAASLSLQLMEKEGSSEYSVKIKKQLDRLNRLEEALLMLSKMDAGTLLLKQEKVDIYTVLNLAAENISDLLLKEHISVDIPDKGCIEFFGDLEWTMEALINLMKNCMEHSHSGGHIYCDYTWNPLYAEIQIWDEGRGFAPEDLPHLFERFYRGKYAVSNGIGIGLALARSIFELQNGTVTARNLQAGGACFEIRIYSH